MHSNRLIKIALEVQGALRSLLGNNIFLKSLVNFQVSRSLLDPSLPSYSEILNI